MFSPVFLPSFQQSVAGELPEPAADPSGFCFIAVDGHFFHPFFLSHFVLVYASGLQRPLPMSSTVQLESLWKKTCSASSCMF